MAAATFQGTVNITYGFGVPGDLIQDGPQRAEPLQLDTNGGTVGNFFTKSNSTNVATQGGTIAAGTVVPAGFLVNSKEYASTGPSGGAPIDPTLVLKGFSTGDFLTMGTIVVQSTSACNIGDWAQYNTTTGAISFVAPGAAASGGNALILNGTAASGAVCYRYPITGGSGLTAVRVSMNNI